MPRSSKVFKKRKNVGRPILKNESPQPRPKETPVSSSTKKIGSNIGLYKDLLSTDSEYVILDVVQLNMILFENAVCKGCGGSLSVNCLSNIGLASKLGISCDGCRPRSNPKKDETQSKHYYSSTEALLPYASNKKMFDINLRFIYALRAAGRGQSAADMFCGIMNLPNPPKISSYLDLFVNTATNVSFNSMMNAVEESIALNEGSHDLCVALDGTWQRRGHRSLNGVVTATSIDTGKVVDYEVMSKYCRCPNKYQNTHLETCSANYAGVSGGMELHGVTKIYQRSEATRNARYVQYLGDGDSKAYQNVSSLEVYGKDCPITKLECIGHVKKRMGTRLMSLRTKFSGKKLGDNKGLSGKGRLTENAVTLLTTYYHLAIKRHSDNDTSTLEDMRKAVWAIYFHVGSSDEKPAHSLCPEGVESWCKYRKAQANNETYKHSEHFHLPEVVMIEIKQIFRDLSQPALLKKCLHGKTQNPNESVNGVIWARLPKTTFVGLKTLQFGVAEAVASFNEGAITKCRILEGLGLKVGNNCIKAMQAIDRERIRRAEKDLQELTIKAQKKSNTAKRKLEEVEEEADNAAGPSYAPGAY